MVLGIHEEQDKYADIIKANNEAFNIHIGQKLRINGRKYTVIEKYPHIIRAQADNGEIMTLNKGDLVQFRVRAAGSDMKMNGGRAVVCLTDGKRYKSTMELARAMNMPQATVWRKIENMELIGGKLYRWAE